jgi:hypothetical protein
MSLCLDWCRKCRIDRIYRSSLKQENRTLLHAINAIPEQINRHGKRKRVKAHHEAEIILLGRTIRQIEVNVTPELSHSLAIEDINPCRGPKRPNSVG